MRLPAMTAEAMRDFTSFILVVLPKMPFAGDVNFWLAVSVVVALSNRKSGAHFS